MLDCVTPSASTRGGYSTAQPAILAQACIGFAGRSYPLPIDYRLLQAEAEGDGRRCVVAGLILDSSGRTFVHRRSWQRASLPGAWDVAGSHVDAGETLLEALGREVREEPGGGSSDRRSTSTSLTGLTTPRIPRASGVSSTFSSRSKVTRPDRGWSVPSRVRPNGLHRRFGGDGGESNSPSRTESPGTSYRYFRPTCLSRCEPPTGGVLRLLSGDASRLFDATHRSR